MFGLLAWVQSADSEILLVEELFFSTLESGIQAQSLCMNGLLLTSLCLKCWPRSSSWLISVENLLSSGGEESDSWTLCGHWLLWVWMDSHQTSRSEWDQTSLSIPIWLLSSLHPETPLHQPAQDVLHPHERHQTLPHRECQWSHSLSWVRDSCAIFNLINQILVILKVWRKRYHKNHFLKILGNVSSIWFSLKYCNVEVCMSSATLTLLKLLRTLKTTSRSWSRLLWLCDLVTRWRVRHCQT